MEDQIKPETKSSANPVTNDNEQSKESFDETGSKIDDDPTEHEIESAKQTSLNKGPIKRNDNAVKEVNTLVENNSYKKEEEKSNNNKLFTNEEIKQANDKPKDDEIQNEQIYIDPTDDEIKRAKQRSPIIKGSIALAGLYPIATAIMQMGKGMTADPALVTMGMIVLLAAARATLSQQLSTDNTIKSLQTTPIKAYQNYWWTFYIIPRRISFHTQKELSDLRRANTLKFVYSNPFLNKIINEEIQDSSEAKNARTNLFHAINNHNNDKNHEDIFKTIENSKIDKNFNNDDLETAKNLYLIKAALLETDFRDDFPGEGLNKLAALEKVIEKILKGAIENKEKQKNENEENDSNQNNESSTSESVVALIEEIKKQKINSEKLNSFLVEFKGYIQKLSKFKLIQDIENKIKTEAKEKEKEKKRDAINAIINEIYNCVLLPELYENDKLIRSRRKTIIYHLIPSLLFVAILLGNAATFTVFTHQKGVTIVKKFLELLGQPFSLIPSGWIIAFVAIFFTATTFLISWCFGGGCVKEAFDEIGQGLQRLFKVDNQIKRAYDEESKKDENRKQKNAFWGPLIFGLFVGLGANMVLFDYVYNGDTFKKVIPIGRAGRIYLIFSIYITTVCFFKVLYTKLAQPEKGHFAKISDRCNNFEDDKGVVRKRTWGTIGFHIFCLLSIILSLCYVLVVSDISKARPALKSLFDIHNEYALIICTVLVGIFSGIYNVTYSSKSLNKIHENGIKLWNKLPETWGKPLAVASFLMLIATITLISLPSAPRTLAFSFIGPIALSLPIIVYLIFKLFNLNNKISDHKTKCFQLIFLSIISCFALTGATLAYNNLISEAVANSTCRWSLRISSTLITLGLLGLFFKYIYDHKTDIYNYSSYCVNYLKTAIYSPKASSLKNHNQGNNNELNSNTNILKTLIK